MEPCKQAGDIIREDELCKVSKQLRAINSGGIGHQGKNTDGRVDHDNVKHLINDVGTLIHEFRDYLGLLADDDEGDGKNHCKEHHLHNILICHGRDDVRRDHTKQEAAETGRREV